MRTNRRRIISTVLTLLLLAALATCSFLTRAQEVAKQPDPSLSTKALKAKAARIADNYGKLEQLILRMSEIEALTNPQRASLLKRAVQLSADRRTQKQLEQTISLLEPPAKLKRAIDEEEQALADMKSLLDLLLSEDRADRLKSKENQIRGFIKELDKLIRLQRSAEGRTRGGGDAKKLSAEQDRIAKRTGDLNDKIGESEEGGQSGEPNESPQAGKPQEGDGKSGSGKPGAKGNEKEPRDGEREPKDGDDNKEPTGDKTDKPGDKKNGSKAGDKGSKAGEKQEGSKSDPKSGKKGDGKPQDGQKSEGGSQGDPSQDGQDSQQDQQPQQDQGNPARKRLQAAEERMREAKLKLEEAKRDEAVEEQEKARAELEKAKAELEEILRQLREEEIGRTLAMLEGRFQRMLKKQIEIYESTKRLDKIAADKRGRQVDIQANKLGFEETKLAVEADKALLLLHEEGSSVAFPETVSQMRDDMQQVADRLSGTKIGVLTQGLEEEIIASLEEMIESLQKAQKDLEEQQQQQQQQQGQPGDKPLVDKIAELKMIRALQMRVNTRTTRYSRLLEDSDDPVGQAEDEDLRQSLGKLGERQERIQRVTYDIVLGKNQ
jgi:hypothetical protein